jgi:hypothetical protein
MPTDHPTPTFNALLVSTLKQMGEDARARGARDYQIGVDIMDGANAFRRDGATEPEITAYNHAYMLAQLKAICTENDVPFEETT